MEYRVFQTRRKFPEYFVSSPLHQLTRLPHRAKRIIQLLHHHLRHLLPTRARYISISNRIFRQHNLIPPLRPRSRRRAHANMCHIPSQHDLLAPITQPFQVRIEIRLGEGRGVVLADLVLAAFRGQFGELLGEGRIGREDGCAVGHAVDYMDDVLAVTAFPV